MFLNLNKLSLKASSLYVIHSFGTKPLDSTDLSSTR